MKYSIGQFSELSGFPIDTLRYYERQKLLFPKRDENNRRVYSEKDVAWISFISCLKKTGMSIREMQAVLRDYVYWFNHIRRSNKLKYTTPIKYRNRALGLA